MSDADAVETVPDISIDAERLAGEMHRLSHLFSQFVIEFRSEKARIEPVDPASVVAAEVEFPITWNTGEHHRKVAVDPAEFAKVLHAYRDSNAYLRFSGHKLVVYDEHEPTPVETKDLEKVGSRSTEIPDVDQPTQATMDAVYFRGIAGAVADAECYEENYGTTLTASDGGVVVSGKDVAQWSAPADVEGDEAEVLVASDYLTDIVDAVHPNGDVVLQFGGGNPLQIDSQPPSYDTRWKTTIYLAARIERGDSE